MDSLTNLLPEARFLCRIDNSKGAQNFSVADFAALEPAEVRPITTIPACIGKRSYEGRWWFSGIARHVAYASAWERDVLTYLDYCGDTRQVARDPAIVISARSDRTPPIRPCLMIKSTAGVRSLLLPRADTERSTELAAILAEHAVDVVTVTLPHTSEMRIIQWIAGYRFTRFTLPLDIEQGVRDMCSAVSGLAETVNSAARSLPYDQAALRANVYSQIWRRTITLLDRGALLTDASRVVAARTTTKTPQIGISTSRSSPSSSDIPRTSELAVRRLQNPSRPSTRATAWGRRRQWSESARFSPNNTS